ncbi:hypothetical protein FRC11_001205, partial [Ceratobasidium sp. 423]
PSLTTSTLLGHQISPAKELMKFTGYFLDVGTQYFDWPRYKAAIENRPSYDLLLEASGTTSITQQDNTISFIVDGIGELIYALGGSETGFDQEAITERIKNAFTSLKIKEESGFAYWKRSGSNSAFTYRIIFDVPKNNDDTKFHSLVTTIALKADIYEKSTWFGLVNTSRHNFSAQIDAVRLACSKDFVAGPRP